MKLVELLAAHVKEWDENTQYIYQDGNDTVLCVSRGTPKYKEDWDAWDVSPDSVALNYGDSIYGAELGVASDYTEALIDRAQWQAERDRQKGGEWKRHRGGKQPVADGTEIEYKLRDGTIGDWAPERLEWDHTNHGGDIMQYRIISQPQAEEVEVHTPNAKTVEVMNASDRGEGRTFNSAQDLYAALDITSKAKTDQIDGPIKWRDTIIHCQAIIEDCEREIQRNVDLLDAEGLMMQTDSKKAMQHYSADVLPIEEWQIGDIVEVTSVSCGSAAPLGVFTITDIDSSEPKYELDDQYFPNHNQMKFIRRP